jgi:hypothetical protein
LPFELVPAGGFEQLETNSQPAVFQGTSLNNEASASLTASQKSVQTYASVAKVASKYLHGSAKAKPRAIVLQSENFGFIIAVISDKKPERSGKVFRQH